MDHTYGHGMDAFNVVLIDKIFFVILRSFYGWKCGLVHGCRSDNDLYVVLSDNHEIVCGGV